MRIEWGAGTVKTQEGEQEGNGERGGFRREVFIEQRKGHGP